MKALLSTYDKTGLTEFARSLQENGVNMVSTGGTAVELSEAGFLVQQVSEMTGFPEILDGRVKTLHPKIHGGILARRNLTRHTEQLANHGMEPIDLVVVNLYPFIETVTGIGVTLEEALEKIDIGGPTMIRAAAKNFPDVVVVVDPSDYNWVSERLSAHVTGNVGASFLTLKERKNLARKAFQHVALYDTAITQYFSDGDILFPPETTLGYRKLYDLRYGENPHQEASLYADPLSEGGIVRAKQLHGVELSFTNILDGEAAWKVVSEFTSPAVTIIKHTNPCGLAVHTDQVTAYRSAFGGDSVSAYGGVVGFNRSVTVATAEAMRGVLFDMIVAPGYEIEALAILKKRKRTRLLQLSSADGPVEDIDVRKVSGGALIQTVDLLEENSALWDVVTKRKPTEVELKDLVFAWKAAKLIKSNAIVLAKDSMLVGMGAGQPNRVTSVHLAFRIAGSKAKGSVLASDAFFPFDDSVKQAAKGGVSAIVQPGGSIRDGEVVAAANELNMAMVFTGTRHFKH